MDGRETPTNVALGRRALIAGAAGVMVGAALRPTAVGAEGAATAFQVVDPTRLADTRRTNERGGPFGFRVVDARTLRIQVANRRIDTPTSGLEVVPANATAAVFTLVGINRFAGSNFLSAFPAATRFPGNANLNMQGANVVVPNLVTVKLGAGGAVDIRKEFDSEVIVDLVGVYVPTGGQAVREGRYTLLPITERILDTRDLGAKPGRGRLLSVSLEPLVRRGLVDRDAVAVSINLAATRSNRGFISAFPFGADRPATSTLNVAQGETRSIGTMVKLGTNAQGELGFHVFLEQGAHLIVDVNGFMTGPSANRSTTGQFVPVDPKRLHDSRRGVGGQKRLWANWSREIAIPADIASRAGAVALNLAATRSMQLGHFTVHGARLRRPGSANLNVQRANQNVSNHVISEVSTKGFEVWSSGGSDIVCDLVGWYTSTSGPRAPLFGSATVNPDPQPAPTPYQMDIPRIGLSRKVLDGPSGRIVDGGNIWHWSGTGLVGQRDAIATFGHRTDAGGPLRFVHRLRAGDQIALFTTDQRKYTYEYVDRVLTDADPDRILSATRFFEGAETLSVIACTVGYDRTKSAYPDPWAPTSLRYRIVVRLRLVRWEDVRADTR